MKSPPKERILDKVFLANIPASKEIPVVRFPVRLWWDHFRITEREVDGVWVEQRRKKLKSESIFYKEHEAPEGIVFNLISPEWLEKEKEILKNGKMP